MSQIFNRKNAIGLALIGMAATVMLGVTLVGANLNFLVANLGVELGTAQTIADLIMAGGTLATILGIIGAATGIGLAVAAAIGTLRAIARNQGRQAVINY